MEKTKDWSALVTPRVLLVGENATLQWSDEVIEYVMFLDYYFRKKPYDHGERSRYTEAASIFMCVNQLSSDRYRPQEVTATNLSMNILPRPPKGKHILIPEDDAATGVKHISKILADNPTIETVIAMSIQANYWLQKLGLYSSSPEFLYGAQPREVGLKNPLKFYQPVDAKVFNAICGKIFSAEISGRNVNIIPILPAKDYPLFGDNYDRFSQNYADVAEFFKRLK